MKTLRYIVLALFFLLLVAVVVGFFLPAKIHLERSILINRDKATIFKLINSFENFNKWSPWYDLDKTAKYELSGAKSGVGAKLSWHSDGKAGQGSNEIIESVVDSHIKTILFFGKPDTPSYSIISLQEQGNQTKVTWAFENDFGMNVFYRYFGLVIEDMIAPDYEKGLANMKKYVESLPFYDYKNVSIVQTSAEKVYAIAAKANPKTDDISTIIGNAYGKIIVFLSKNNIAMNGSPKIINKKNDENSFEFLAAIPVLDNTLADEAGNIQALTSYAGKAVKIVHKGSYANFKQSYTILDAYIQQNHLEKNGNSWEDYITDPATTAESELVTNIYQPIK